MNILLIWGKMVVIHSPPAIQSHISYALKPVTSTQTPIRSSQTKAMEKIDAAAHDFGFFNIMLWLDLGHRLLLFSSRTNLESGSRFAEICSQLSSRHFFFFVDVSQGGSFEFDYVQYVSDPFRMHVYMYVLLSWPNPFESLFLGF